ncbi:MAG TPA: metallophosphoesterase family protein, partial [Candidatus Acidoferrum sp.]|nr:metallophosphoesterase family protein [Candidatus Acidoferrum sp.]
TPSAVSIRWRTQSLAPSIVAYGTNSGALTQSVQELTPKREHELRVTGLSQSMKYFYAVSNLTTALASGADYFFFTHPSAGTPKPTRVWVIGDCGTANTLAEENQRGVRDAYYDYASTRYTDVWLALGDNAYYDGSDENYQVNFFDIYPTLLRQTAVWSTIGNHETSFAGPTWAYDDIFTFPANGEADGVLSGTERYYSFDYANIHFISLDSQVTSRSATGPMATWLKADLAVNTNPWIIAFFHHPPYTMGSHHSDTDVNHIEMRENIVPILESYGVDLVLGGHSHIYERSMFLHGHYGDSFNLLASHILNAGSGRPGQGGAYLKAATGPRAGQGAVYVVAGSSGWATFRTGYHPAMFMDELERGSLVLDISSNRLDAVFLRDTGAIDDSFTIIKTEPVEIAMIRRANGAVVAEWKSKTGSNYRVERAVDIEAPDWQPVSNVITATGTTTSWTNGTPGSADRSFYRVTEIGE